MKRATITLPNDLAEALEAYQRDQEVPPPLTAVAQVALKEYLAARGYLAPTRHLRITPAPSGRPAGGREVTMKQERVKVSPPSPEELARRQAVGAQILAQREKRRIAPMTTAELVHLAREESPWYDPGR